MDGNFRESRSNLGELNVELSNRMKWLALMVLCLGDLMIVLDTTIVNVALPSIRDDLGFSQTSLVWVMNAYMLTFGGFLLLGGRLGDLYGQRRLLLIGIISFTIASLGCGIANSQAMLIIARAVQGLAGAIVSAVALSLMMNIFTTGKDRAKAMGIFGFVMAGGGSLGVLLGGLLTDLLKWNWIFLVNLPIGIVVVILSIILIPKDKKISSKVKLDVWGAITITSSLMLAVYAIVNGNEMGWLSPKTIGMMGVALGIFWSFLAIEKKVRHPLMPMDLFKVRNIATSNAIGVLWAAAMFAWFFLSALYMQMILGYTPMQVGLAFLPSNIIMAIFSIGVSAWMVDRFGIKIPITLGMGCVALGLILFGFSAQNGTFMLHVLPGMILLGLGAGMALNPVLLCAMNDVKPHESGLASGLVNTSFMMGGALGLAILASIAGSRTEWLIHSGVSQISATLGGFHLAFIVGALFGLIAALLSAFTIKQSKPSKKGAGGFH